MSIATPAGDTRLMLRAAQLYYHADLTQDAIGKRLGVSRFKVGRLLDRAIREEAVRIEIVHPAARLVALEDAREVYVARTYAYVAAGRQGLAIVDVTRPTEMPARRALWASLPRA